MLTEAKIKRFAERLEEATCGQCSEAATKAFLKAAKELSDAAKHAKQCHSKYPHQAPKK